MQFPESSFPLGAFCMTPKVQANLNPVEMFMSLRRHASRDWGTVSGGDWKANDRALKNDGRIISAYTASDGSKVLIITEADRSATTILYSSEY